MLGGSRSQVVFEHPLSFLLKRRKLWRNLSPPLPRSLWPLSSPSWPPRLSSAPAQVDLAWTKKTIFKLVSFSYISRISVLNLGTPGYFAHFHFADGRAAAAPATTTTTTTAAAAAAAAAIAPPVGPYSAGRGRRRGKRKV